MTVTLNLKPEVEAGLLAKAQEVGLTVEAFALAVLEGAILPTMPKALPSEERATAFEAWSAGHSVTQPLSDNAVSRDAIYESPAPRGDRAEAVRRMLEFGEKHNLSLGEPITRVLLHDGHRY